MSILFITCLASITSLTYVFSLIHHITDFYIPKQKNIKIIGRWYMIRPSISYTLSYYVIPEEYIIDIPVIAPKIIYLYNNNMFV